MSSATTPPALPVKVPLAKPSPSQQVLQSSELLGTRQAIEIEHNGQRYRLQSTKSGKLILTK
jgi:hemin uptake protein HemP